MTRLAWIGPPEALGADAIAERLHADLETRLEALSEAAWRTRRRTDAEAIHDARVAARRLAEMLSVWRALLASRPRRRAQQALRGFRRALGPARELEACIETAEKHLRDEPALERAAARPLVREMRKKLVRERAKAGKAARAGAVGRIIARVEESAADVEGAFARSPEVLQEVRRRIERRRQSAERTIQDALAGEDDAVLHRARIAVKKWRYALECGRAVDPHANGAELEQLHRLRDLQRSLGAIHDRAVLLDLLARWMKRFPMSRRAGTKRLATEPWRRLLRSLARERQRQTRRFRQLAHPVEHPQGTEEPTFRPPLASTPRLRPILRRV